MNAINKIREKLENSKGETLVEVLVATLIAAIAMLGLATMINASKNIMDTSAKAIDDFYSHVNKVEREDASVKSPEKGTITITGEFGTINIDVNMYISEDVASYQLE